MVAGRLRVLLSVANEKNTDILLRFGQADLPNKSTNMSGDEHANVSPVDMVDGG